LVVGGIFGGLGLHPLPATTGQGYDFEVAPSDLAVDHALRMARQWRRLAEMRIWKPLADVAATRETLQFLGFGKALPEADITEWMTAVDRLEQGPAPALIRAGRAAKEWMNRAQVKEPLTLDGIFLAACMWRQSGFGRAIALPFWLAPEQRLNRLAPRVGVEWMAGFLDCVAEAAKAAAAERGPGTGAARRGQNCRRPSMPFCAPPS
jgi:hypothetical protein